MENTCDILQPGAKIFIELGAVKCYENGVYKYDRWYMKAGESKEKMQYAIWFDSTQRGKYGTAVSTRGTDISGMDFTIKSLKQAYTIEDVSGKKETEKLKCVEAIGSKSYAVYYPKNVLGYNELSKAKEVAEIKLYPKEGMKLSTLKVSGKDVTSKVKKTDDGGYVYKLESVKENIEFSYSLKKEGN